MLGFVESHSEWVAAPAEHQQHSVTPELVEQWRLAEPYEDELYCIPIAGGKQRCHRQFGDLRIAKELRILGGSREWLGIL